MSLDDHLSLMRKTFFLGGKVREDFECLERLCLAQRGRALGVGRALKKIDV